MLYTRSGERHGPRFEMRTLFQRNITEHVATNITHTFGLCSYFESRFRFVINPSPLAGGSHPESEQTSLKYANYSRGLHSEDGFTASEVPNLSKFAENLFISDRSASARLKLIGYVWKVSSLLPGYRNTSSGKVCQNYFLEMQCQVL